MSGFGVVKCHGCGKTVQGEPVYFQVVRRIKVVGKRCRKAITELTLCPECWDEVENGR